MPPIVKQQWTKYSKELPDPLKPYIHRFLSRVVILAKDECWIWQGTSQKDKDGNTTYGLLWVNGKPMKVHRFSLCVREGRMLRSEEHACHSCDTTLCVNPNHLFISDMVGNRADCVAKHRQAKGEKVNTARLTETEVLAIRNRYQQGETIRELALEYGPYSTVEKVVYGYTWRHLLCRR